MDTPDTLVPPPTPPTVRIGRRDLVVVAGLPGAGKSTLLHRLQVTDPVPVLDPEQIYRRLRSVLPKRFSHSRYRAVVHLAHRFRIAWYCACTSGPVIAHEPSTRATTRAMLVIIGRLTRRPQVLVWLHAGAFEALAGQRERGRMIGTRSFARHVGRAERLRHLLHSRRHPHGWYAVHVFTRGDLREGMRLEWER